MLDILYTVFKLDMLILGIIMEGTVSLIQALDLTLGKVENKFFEDKIKTKTFIKNLRHHSLHMNVFDMYSKFHRYYLNINVQKIKVIKCSFYFLFLFTRIDHGIINISRKIFPLI